ncbi:MAG: acyl-CoA dehydrogenase family protein [Myxococcales bacterium]|nr:acyl-CoA dehydrogenase family protein [Myxococcales bacterium]MCB9650523.1 acyl-CoA dehydrogenase family protein [Deltaproteobacteria bacterium]
MAEPFYGTDLYNVDGLLDEDERLVRDNVARWVDDRFLPLVTEHYRAGTFPTELAPEMGEMGLLGTSLQGYGCPSMSGVIYGLAMEELERGDSGLRSFASVQGSLAMFPIWKFGSEAQKEKYLPKMAAGQLIGCFGLTEPDHGSDPGGMKTRAVKDGDEWVISGEKLWITNGSVADLAIVWAKTGEDASTIRGFIVEKGTPGFSAYDVKGKFSLRASVTSGLVLEEVRVKDSQMLPEVQGLKGPLSCLNQARYGIAWGAVGAAIAVYRASLDYAKDRVQFGRPIAGFQLQQAKFADMISEIVKAQLLVLQLGRLKDAGKHTPVQVSLAKRNNVKMALEAARMAREILGANGIHDEYPVFRHMTNLESVYTYEGTHDIHTLILGKHVTGISAFV